MPQTLDQQRAQAAWKATEAEPVTDDYVSLCSGAPVMILTNGLGPALAFFLAKAANDSHYRRLADALGAWILQDDSKKGKDLMIAITKANTSMYRRYTDETLAYLNWLKRFADARKYHQPE